jgi:hypothetical protein
MARRRRLRLLFASVASSTALVLAAAPATWAGPDSADLSRAQRLALEAGIQVSPKAAARSTAKSKLGVNPYLANLPDASRADYASWRKQLAVKGDQRASSSSLARARVRAAGRVLAAPFVHDEEEPAGTAGSNDSQGNAELVRGFGTGRRENPRVRILGQLVDLAPASRPLAVRREDNGALRLATATRINGTGARTSTSVLGDGPHGSAADGSNDFDFFALTSREGLAITVDTSTTEEVDTVVAVYDAAGELLAVNDDAFIEPNILASRLTFDVPADGTYYVLVGGFSPEGSLPEDPTDSGSGAGGAAEGPYQVKITSSEVDRDYYALRLDKGDVIGSVGNGAASNLRIWRPDGTQMVGADSLDASFLYAPQSPLPGGGNTTLAYVAEESGTYAIQVLGTTGNYDTLVEAYRPGSELDPAPRVQTVFLDFDGARVNTGIWGGPGVRTLSPFGSFVARWGLPRSQEAVLINRITATVRENIRRDLIEKGRNDQVAVRVINSATSRDIFGRTNVSRVIVGGTIAQAAIPTIGVAQYIDPGNYGHEDSALVLLDVLSDRARDNDASLNFYLRRRSDRVGFVSRAVANVISHEIGHLIGNFHTDASNETPLLMDSGGANFGTNLYGVGPDGIGGTADDQDIDFGTDNYAPEEGFTGVENALNVSAWAYVRSRSTP